MAAKGEMLYAWTTDADLQSKAECGGAVTALLKYALESKAVDAVLRGAEGDRHLRRPADPDHRPEGPGQHGGLAPLRDPAPAQADQEVPRRRREDEDRRHGQGLRHDGHVRAGQARPDQPGQRRHDRRQLRRIGQPDRGAEDDRREVRARPGRRGQGGDRQGPVHRHDEGRDPQGDLHRRTRGGGLRPPDELPPLPAQGPPRRRPRRRKLGRHRRRRPETRPSSRSAARRARTS